MTWCKILVGPRTDQAVPALPEPSQSQQDAGIPIPGGVYRTWTQFSGGLVVRFELFHPKQSQDSSPGKMLLYSSFFSGNGGAEGLSIPLAKGKGSREFPRTGMKCREMAETGAGIQAAAPYLFLSRHIREDKVKREKITQIESALLSEGGFSNLFTCQW